MRDLVLVLAIVVHGPDFLGSGACTDEVDLGFGDAVDAAAQARNDLIGKAMSQGSSHILTGGLVVLLAQHLGAGGVASVVEPAGDAKSPVGRGQRSEGDH